MQLQVLIFSLNPLLDLAAATDVGLNLTESQMLNPG